MSQAGSGIFCSIGCLKIEMHTPYAKSNVETLSNTKIVISWRLIKSGSRFILRFILNWSSYDMKNILLLYCNAILFLCTNLYQLFYIHYQTNLINELKLQSLLIGLPATATHSPVIYADWGDNKKCVTFAMSYGTPNLFTFMYFIDYCSSLSQSSELNFVLISPGAIAFTLMSSSTNSRANNFVKATNAVFVIA